MSLEFVRHKKVSLRKHPTFNEKWLHDRIADDPTILGLGDIRLLDRERLVQGGGRLDLLLLDDDNNRRYEVEIQLGPTDPSHIVRAIEYWDVERRRYPGYEHVAVLVAEDITTRFLNVMSLMAGSIPMVAVQLDALQVENSLLLNFTTVLDQSELRVDDTDDDGGGGQVDRKYWEAKAGKELMRVCDAALEMINEFASTPQEFNYLKGHIGLQSNGVVNNFVWFAPKPMKKFTHIFFRNSNAGEWQAKFEEAGVLAVSKRSRRFRISLKANEFSEHKELIHQAIEETVKEYEG